MVTYANNFVRLSFGGRLFDTEQWNCNISMGGSGGDTDGGLTNAELASAATKVQAFFANPNVAIHQGVKLDYVKGNQVGVNGKYTTPFVPITHLYPTPPVGAHTNRAPAQHTVAMSWVTARKRGPGAFGRIYPPTGYIIIDATGRIDLTTANNMAAAGKSFLDSLNTIRPGMRVIVASAGGVGVPPAHVPVTGVRVGRLPDNQRRRRESLPEGFSVTSALESV